MYFLSLKTLIPYPEFPAQGMPGGIRGGKSFETELCSSDLGLKSQDGGHNYLRFKMSSKTFYNLYSTRSMVYKKNRK